MKRSLLVLLGLIAVAAAAACDGGDDDDDSSATPSPTNFVPVGCQIVWITQDPPGQSRYIDYYIVDAPVATWTNGSHVYSQGDATGATNVTGAFVDGFDLVNRVHDAAMVATAGDFSISGLDAANPLAAGNPVQFADSTGQTYFLLDTANNLGASQGTSGTGTFNGVWSQPDDPDVTEGAGTITIVFAGTSQTLGSDLTYALCYDEAAFAPRSAVERVREAGARAAEILRSR